MPSGFAIEPPVEPMLAKLTEEIPGSRRLSLEPKWDGFRSIVFRGDDDVFIQSRDLNRWTGTFPSFTRYFSSVSRAVCVIDGEIVIATPRGLEFDTLQMRLHPAASRVTKLAKETPASFVAFDLLAIGSRSLMEAPQHERRTQLESLLAHAEPPLHLTPMTRDRGWRPTG